MEYTNQLKKYVRSLHMRKYRQKYDKFIAEGPKICEEFKRGNHTISHIFCVKNWLDENPNAIDRVDNLTVIKERELQQISALKTANQVLFVIDRPSASNLDLGGDVAWMLYLDKIQDPGNLGTIIRIADWYNISCILLSHDSVDPYNPKVIQSAMGGHNRIKTKILESIADLQSIKKPLYGLALRGADINTLSLDPGILIVGNESKGIRPELLPLLDQKITISKIGGAESLNASVACGIACHCLVSRA